MVSNDEKIFMGFFGKYITRSRRYIRPWLLSQNTLVPRHPGLEGHLDDQGPDLI